MKKLLTICFLFALVLPVQLFAGWIITGRYVDAEGKTTMRRYFIEGNNLKFEQYNLIYSYNFESGRLILVDPENLLFVKTTFDEYRNKLMSKSQSRLQSALEEIPEDQRSNYETAYRNQSRAKVYLTPTASDSLLIMPMPDSAKLLGMNTFKYQVKESGRKKEEFFLTNEKTFLSDKNLLKLLNLNYLIFPDDLSVLYQSSTAYMALVQKGLVVKRTVFQDGYKTEWQVSKMEEKNIPEYEFGQPSLCKELSLDQWLARTSVAESNYDDYE